MVSCKSTSDCSWGDPHTTPAPPRHPERRFQEENRSYAAPPRSEGKLPQTSHSKEHHDESAV